MSVVYDYYRGGMHSNDTVHVFRTAYMQKRGILPKQQRKVGAPYLRAA